MEAVLYLRCLFLPSTSVTGVPRMAPTSSLVSTPEPAAFPAGALAWGTPVAALHPSRERPVHSASASPSPRRSNFSTGCSFLLRAIKPEGERSAYFAVVHR